MNISKLIGRLQVMLLLVGLVLWTSTAHAQTLEIYVNPTTWAYDHHTVSGAGYTSFGPFTVTSGSETRYYYGGSFDIAIVRNVNTSAQLAVINPCNNICYISGTNLYALTTGFNGSGNGVSGAILVAAKFSNGDLYIGGTFGLAGGYSHANRFSCYRFSSGWSGVNEIEVTGGVGTVVNSLSFVGYKLQVGGTFTTVHGPITSGGSVYNSINVNNVAFWNEWNQSFPACYWTSN